MKKIIGIDIGGTKTSVVLATYDDDSKIDFIDKEVFSTKVQEGPDNTIKNIFKHIDLLIKKNDIGGGNFTIGISCGGPLDAKNGIILSPPNLIGWDNVNIVWILEERYGVPVFLQNDANACVLAEWMMGAGEGFENIVYLTFGTGLGAGLVLNNRLYSGANGMAGEVGHIRLEKMGPTGYGKSGSFEGFCSGNGITQLASSIILERLQTGQRVEFCPDLNSLREITAKSIFDAAKAGDPVALQIAEMSGTYLGRGISIIIDILNPEIIILGTIYVLNHELLYPYVHAAIQEEAIPRSAETCRIVPAKLGDKLGDYAAVTTALYGLKVSQKDD